MGIDWNRRAWMSRPGRTWGHLHCPRGRLAWLAALTSIALLSDGAAGRAGTAPLELGDGDRVILLGDTLIERAQVDDYLETLLTIRHPGKRIIFRNLGWSGDTVGGDARAGFDTPREGYQRLIEGVRSLSPTVIVVGYGGGQAFDGPSGLKPFQRGLNRLLDDLASTGARLAILGIVRHEHLPPPLPNPRQSNEWRREYNEVLRRTAEERGLPFVDLFRTLVPESDSAPVDPEQALTDNGVHLNARGYWRLAELIDRACAPADEAVWSVEIDLASGSFRWSGTRPVKLELKPQLRMELIDDRLAAPPRPKTALPDGRAGLLTIRGLPAGAWTLAAGEATLVTARHDQWASGVRLDGPAVGAPAEALRQLIRRKNELYFHRWRPQNETYLFGFRKHEQGQNAIEVPRFDPLVAEQESLIAEQARPRVVVYRLERSPEKPGPQEAAP